MAELLGSRVQVCIVAKKLLWGELKLTCLTWKNLDFPHLSETIALFKKSGYS